MLDDAEGGFFTRRAVRLPPFLMRFFLFIFPLFCFRAGNSIVWSIMTGGILLSVLRNANVFYANGTLLRARRIPFPAFLCCPLQWPMVR